VAHRAPNSTIEFTLSRTSSFIYNGIFIKGLHISTKSINNLSWSRFGSCNTIGSSRCCTTTKDSSQRALIYWNLHPTVDEYVFVSFWTCYFDMVRRCPHRCVWSSGWPRHFCFLFFGSPSDIPLFNYSHAMESSQSWISYFIRVGPWKANLEVMRLSSMRMPRYVLACFWLALFDWIFCFTECSQGFECVPPEVDSRKEDVCHVC